MNNIINVYNLLNQPCVVLCSVSEVSPEGRLTESVLPLSTLCSRAPALGPDLERVSTGTKYALELWLKTLETQGSS